MKTNQERATWVAFVFTVVGMILVPTAPNGGETVWLVGLLLAFGFAWVLTWVSLWLGDLVARVRHGA